MRYPLAFRSALVAVALCAAPSSAQTDLDVVPHTFTADDGRTVEAELGRFRVAENRDRPDGRTIGLAFVRFPATTPTPGPPIVYLAGGPGGSGTSAARGARFDLFQALREVADVVAFDQRGTGLSETLPDCPRRVRLPPEVPGSRNAYAAAWTATAEACAAHWRALGVDLAAYTTAASADDLDDLRRALGAERISLWAISYGTHLALATISRHPDAVASAVLAGVEGPDHTDKLPSHQQALLEQIDAIHRSQNPGAPSLLDDLAVVLGRLQEAPVVVGAGDDAVAVTAFDVQWLVANMLRGPEQSMGLPEMAAAMRGGDFAGVARWLGYLKAWGDVSAMAAAVDAASGASLWRRARIAHEAERTLLGDAINFPGPVVRRALRVPDLGPAFRAPVVSDVPTLFVSGTLDGRTPPANADEVRAGFSRHAHLVVEGAGHSDPLFLGSPVILERMRALFEGEVGESATIPMAEGS